MILNKNHINNIELINKNKNELEIIINIYKLDNYKIFKLIFKINNIINIYDEIHQINIKFDNNINECSKILTKINDIIYKYNSKINIKIFNVSNYCINLMNELFIYKDIVMNPNINPENYLKYIKLRLPKYYNYKLFNIKKKPYLFPLTAAVGLGSKYNSYFIHIYPKKKIKNKKNIYLIGKAVTYDSGGLNLKSHGMEEMKIDMLGSAILISVINLIHTQNNIHVLIPIVENMISPDAIKPGSIIKTSNNKTVEIMNTDAEGRLCIVDAINYCNKIIDKNSIIIDIATLTGNTERITGCVSAICITNDLGNKYYSKLSLIGDNIGEYVDNLKLRNEYLELLKSPVADIKSINNHYKCDCILAGSFISYFINNNIPWIHIDLASCVYKNDKVLSYGINLLYNFLINI